MPTDQPEYYEIPIEALIPQEELDPEIVSQERELLRLFMNYPERDKFLFNSTELDSDFGAMKMGINLNDSCEFEGTLNPRRKNEKR